MPYKVDAIRQPALLLAIEENQAIRDTEVAISFPSSPGYLYIGEGDRIFPPVDCKQEDKIFIIGCKDLCPRVAALIKVSNRLR